MTDYGCRELRRSRYAYIGEAALEYLIAILVQGTFLAQVTMNIGFTDSQTGIISSVISLGCLFQLASLFWRKGTVKKFVLGMSIANQVLFLLLYTVPFIPFSGTVKKAVFLVFIFSAYGIYYIAHPKKIGWLMSLVEDDHRGRFTATKEMISLAAGILFSYGMGVVVDHFRDAGDATGAFVICSVVMAMLMILHAVTMLICVELPGEAQTNRTGVGFFRNLLAVTRQKNTMKIAVVFALWYFGSYFTTSFYGTYQLRELGMTQSVTTLLVAAGSICRIAVSRPLGAFADRFSFTAMIRVCMMFAAAGFGCAAFATQPTGVICFLLFQVFHGVAMGGINSALTNLVFDYTPPESRADSLALCQSTAGICGFFATICGSRVVEAIQCHGNRLLGIPVYAQQVTSMVAVVVTLVTVLYITAAFRKKTEE